MFGKRYPNCVKKEEAEVRYCPKCEKNETREECAYGGKYWDENSMPAKDVKEATIELTDAYGETFATVETETEAKVEESKKRSNSILMILSL